MSSLPSSNWLQLQKKISGGKKNKHFKKRKHDHDDARSGSPTPSQSSHIHHEETGNGPSTSASADTSLPSLRAMVEGRTKFNEKHRLPGRYLAVDCEMVGVGHEGEESSLARVSIVNFYGAIILDEFVKQRERVVDYRTQFSGIRPSDMTHAKPFDEVQKEVATLLKDQILVGHAVHNDLKALLLSHPYPLTRDTQVLAFKSKLTKSKRIALRNLVKQELDMTIQGGEHSSVTDARATMAVYRLHKKSWDKLLGAFARPEVASAGKRKASELDSDAEADNAPSSSKTAKKNATLSSSSSSSSKGQLPGPAGRKGVSSGLSTIVKRGGVKVGGSAKGGGKGGGKSGGDSEKSQWWSKLPSTGAKKGSMKLSM